MIDSIIEVENISKQYRLGEVSTGTVAHDLNRWWSRIRGKEDPTLCVTDSNDREHTASKDQDYIWALKDINFEVKRGEVLGIIGRNGAGKSTLLKILSRVTAPTRGEIRVDGRIASLLEVGTGFHPELTGEENIFLNGAILGMTKTEIRSKLDEIVEFSGCARYLDTPVKRYSSGMVVRLGFAVAAHLEPDILIVDEVLAVGDAEFQKKCIGKMQDVASHGRTVLFVSHNMGAINSLCSKALLLDSGCTDGMGPTSEITKKYLEYNAVARGETQANGVIQRCSLVDAYQEPTNYIHVGDRFTVEVVLNIPREFTQTILSMAIKSDAGDISCILGTFNEAEEVKFKEGRTTVRATVDPFMLCPGGYYLTVDFRKVAGELIERQDDILSFSVLSAKSPTNWSPPKQRRSWIAVSSWEFDRS